MADDVTAPLTAPLTLAFDLIDGVYHQRVKVQYGADGSATDVDEGHGIPVTLVHGLNADADFVTAILAAVYNTLPDRYPTGSRVPIQADSRGHMTVAEFAPNTNSFITATSAGPIDGAITMQSVGKVVSAQQWVRTGAAFDPVRSASMFWPRPDGAITAGSPVLAHAPTTGKRFRVMGGELSLSVAGQIILMDGATVFVRSPLLAAGATWNVRETLGCGNGYLSTVIDNTLRIDVSATGNVAGTLAGLEE